MKLLKTILIFVVLTLAGCSASPHIKTLSTHQMEYFDAAITAITTQSEALILASETVAAQAKAEIDRKEQENQAELQKLLQDLPRYSPDKQAQITAGVLERIANTTRETERAKLKLDEDIKVISEQSAKLTAHVEKMKDIHLAIDAYIQSEQVGDHVLTNILQHPTVSDLLAKSQALLPKIQEGSQQLETAIESLQAQGGAQP